MTSPVPPVLVIPASSSSSNTISISPYPSEPSTSVDDDVGASEYSLIVLFSTLSIIGIVGNLLVITVVLKVRGMKTPTNCYLVSLAASDTLFFIASMPHEVMYLIGPTDNYLFGTVGCALLTYLPYLAMNTSSLSITAFTVERFIGICYPYRARTMCTVKRAKSIISILWIVSIVYHSQWLFLAAVVHDDVGTMCSFRLKRNDTSYKIVFLADFLFLYVVPMLLDIIIYVKIGVTLTRCGDKIKQSVKPKVSSDVVDETTTARESHVSGKRTTTKGRHQVVKMLALVVAVFAVCWLPYRAMVMYNSFVSDPKYHWSPDWYINLSKTLIFVNCAINPILYNLMSARFRDAFRTLLSNRKTVAYHTTAIQPPRTRNNTNTECVSIDNQRQPLNSPIL
ncbi:unnamed protein product [Caenorhabditis bovis]|uniref:Thyrotropin-releasing hormone receptor n=1 Tax=Caenorhabditis bovis TaxID=2654633 RepID=A0A8S1F5X9_9PELO|nr:unnamed protein product [Caenorhabditis bovis]